MQEQNRECQSVLTHEHRAGAIQMNKNMSPNPHVMSIIKAMSPMLRERPEHFLSLLNK